MVSIEELKRRKKELLDNIPLLSAFGGKIHKWRLEFFRSTNKIRLLCAGNQAGKSTTAILYSLLVALFPNGYRNKNWDKDNDLIIPGWKKMFPKLELGYPVIWYLYPDGKTVSEQFEAKWLPLLPKGKFKTHPVYGWKMINKSGYPYHLAFNNGVNLYFKTYAQGARSLQSGSVHLVVTDEELPENLYSELQARTFATGGYFFMVFTATEGQEFWRRAMEEVGTGRELLPQAYKRIVSLYDCMLYTDGSVRMTEEEINIKKNSLGTEREIQKRIYGRFVLDDGLVYESFNPKRNVVDQRDIPDGWHRYAGIDIGSGGKNHPSAISFVAVSPDLKKAVLYKFWRGDNEVTTSKDVALKYLEMKAGEKGIITYYDWHAKDFYQIATSMNIPMFAAEKSHEIGENLLNTLFKNQMLELFDLPNIFKLVTEFTSLKSETPKNKAKDDGIDSLRYAISKIPFDFSDIGGKKEIKVKKEKTRGRRITFMEDKTDEFEEWNELYDV